MKPKLEGCSDKSNHSFCRHFD